MEQYLTKETAEAVIRFRDERNWKQFHTPKDLAISMSLEAAELLEVFQWSGTPAASICKKTEEQYAPPFLMSNIFIPMFIYSFTIEILKNKTICLNKNLK